MLRGITNFANGRSEDVAPSARHNRKKAGSDALGAAQIRARNELTAAVGIAN